MNALRKGYWDIDIVEHKPDTKLDRLGFSRCYCSELGLCVVLFYVCWRVKEKKEKKRVKSCTNGS